jgi:hypothetical protein
MSKPISYYYSSRVKPMPTEVEKWLENLPAINKVKVAKALLSQIDDGFTPLTPVAGTIYNVE